jgi:hypothetical protein
VRGRGEGGYGAHLRGLPLLAPAAQVTILLWLIWRRTPRAPVGDEWELANLLELADLGRLDLAPFWAFQNEHRIVLPRLLLYALIGLTAWDRQIILTINLGLACATAGIVILSVRRALGPVAGAILLAPLALLLLSFAQFENWLFAFQTNFILSTFGVACCLWGTLPSGDGREGSNRGFALALAGALIASLSTLGGLLTWPAFLPAVRHLGWRRIALWCASALAVIVPYFIGFPGSTAEFAAGDSIAHYGFVYLGAPLGYPSTAFAAFYGALGTALFGLSLLAFHHAGGRMARAMPWVALGLYGLGNGALTATGRAAFGLQQALTPRYQAFSVFFWIGLLVLVWLNGAQRRNIRADVTGGRVPGARRALLIANAAALPLLALGLLRTNALGLREGYVWQEGLRQREGCILDYDTAPESCLTLFYPSAPIVRIHSAFLEQHRLGPFRDEPATPNFAYPPAPDPALATIDLLDGTTAGPATIEARYNRPIVVRGWALDRATTGPPRAVYLVIDGRYTYRARSGESRPDVAAALGNPAAAGAGFTATLPPGMLTPGPHTLAVRVVATDGSYADSAPETAIAVR